MNPKENRSKRIKLSTIHHHLFKSINPKIFIQLNLWEYKSVRRNLSSKTFANLIIDFDCKQLLLFSECNLDRYM